MVHRELLFEALAEFPRSVVEQRDVGDVLHTLVENLTKVMGLAGAGVSLVVGDALRFVTAQNESVIGIERAQEEAQRGPLLDAHLSGRPVVVADLGDGVEKWPEVVAAAVAVGVHAAAAVPMQLGGEAVGVLDLYDTGPREWSEDELQVARCFADMATAYVVNDSRLQSARSTAKQLQQALDSRVIIEQAKGILAGERQISPDEAFELLRTHARNHNALLQEVATAVVKVGLRP